MKKSSAGLAFGFVFILSAGMAFGAEAPGQAAIARVWPEKIVYKPGETAKITVDVENRTKSALNDLSVSLAINYGLTSRDELPAQKVNLAPNGKETVAFTYAVPKGRKWGHEARAILKDANGSVEIASGYFSVGDNPWELGHYRTVFYIRGKKASGEIEKNMFPRYRKDYVTTLEAYAWQPSFFDCMAPATDIWVSCQGYKEGKEDWLYLVQRAHDQGMAVSTYIQNTSSGPVGCDFLRHRPELLTYDKNGAPLLSIIDIDEMEAYRNEPEKSKYKNMCGLYSAPGSFLPVNDRMGDFWIDQVIKSVEMFGWDGFRSDGNPGVVEGYDYKGEFHKVTDVGAANADFLKKVRRKLTERFPNFLFGWNAAVGGYPMFYPGSAAERAVVTPNAYFLYEFFRSAKEPSSVFHPWKKAGFYLQKEVAAVREGGGFAHAGWMGSHRYLEAVASACGTDIDGWASDPKDKFYPEYRRFEFRWAEFLWDNQLRYILPGDTAVKVEAPESIWWRDFVNARDLPDGRRRVVAHLINMPANDDETWADRPPAPVNNVRVTFNAPQGKKLERIIAFSPDMPGDVIDAKPDAAGTLVIPEVKVWTIVTAEFK